MTITYYQSEFIAVDDVQFFVTVNKQYLGVFRPSKKNK